jgi:hypothetical protein
LQEHEVGPGQGVGVRGGQVGADQQRGPPRQLPRWDARSLPPGVEHDELGLCRRGRLQVERPAGRHHHERVVGAHAAEEPGPVSGPRGLHRHPGAERQRPQDDQLRAAHPAEQGRAGRFGAEQPDARGLALAVDADREPAAIEGRCERLDGGRVDGPAGVASQCGRGPDVDDRGEVGGAGVGGTAQRERRLTVAAAQPFGVERLDLLGVRGGRADQEVGAEPVAVPFGGERHGAGQGFELFPGRPAAQPEGGAASQFGDECPRGGGVQGPGGQAVAVEAAACPPDRAEQGAAQVGVGECRAPAYVDGRVGAAGGRAVGEQELDADGGLVGSQRGQEAGG